MSIADPICKQDACVKFLLVKIVPSQADYSAISNYNSFLKNNCLTFIINYTNWSQIEKVIRCQKSNAIGIDGISLKIILLILPLI